MVLSYLFKALSRQLSGHGLGRNSVLANMYLNTAKILLPNVTVYRGNKIYLESPNSVGLSVFGQCNEEYELSLFESEIEDGSVVLDIGANIGLYTLTAAKHAAKVYSFEPDTVNFSNLKKNIEANHYDNVFPVNKAVSDKSGRAQLSSYSKYPLDRGNLHLVTGDEDVNQKYRLIDTITLDDFFIGTPNKIDIVKMDIEGLEFEAIRGMSNLIDANRDMKFFLEFNPYTLNRHGTDLNSFLDYLFRICSHLYHIDEAKKTQTPVNKEWLMDFAKNKEDGRHINILGLRNKR